MEGLIGNMKIKREIGIPEFKVIDLFSIS